MGDEVESRKDVDQDRTKTPWKFAQPRNVTKVSASECVILMDCNRTEVAVKW